MRPGGIGRCVWPDAPLWALRFRLCSGYPPWVCRLKVSTLRHASVQQGGDMARTAQPSAPCAQYLIWPLARPQMSFQSSCGSALMFLS